MEPTGTGNDNQYPVKVIGTTLSFSEMAAYTSSKLQDIIQHDPLLNDLPEDVTLEEAYAMIALEYGQSVTVYLHREPLDTIPLAIVSDSTVAQLKSQIRTQVARYLQRTSNCTTHLSWRYFWRKHWIVFDNVKLTEDRKTIKEYGIRHKAHIKFARRYKKDTKSDFHPI